MQGFFLNNYFLIFLNKKINNFFRFLKKKNQFCDIENLAPNIGLNMHLKNLGLRISNEYKFITIIDIIVFY
jgi:hypothetical protein